MPTANTVVGTRVLEVILSPRTSRYDEVFANAALMVLYASASHSMRVQLASSAKQTNWYLLDELFPQHLQWILFTRAAHTASAAVLNDGTEVIWLN